MANLVYLADMRELVLTVAPENAGSINVSPPPPQGGIYPAGTVLTLLAQGTAGYQFSGWGGVLNGTANPITFTFSGNQEVKANFALPLTDVTQPGDPVTPTSANSPSTEGAAKAIDNSTQTKYFNFDKLNAGFNVTPRLGSTLVTGLGLTSANDVPARDPASYRLEGSTGGASFALIASGTLPAFTSRLQQQNLFFANTTAYKTYRQRFPTVAGGASADAMQIAEVQFFGVAAPTPPKIVATGVGGVLILSWDSPAAGWILESTSSLLPPVGWTPVSGAADNRLAVPVNDAMRFYRLRR